MTPVRNAYINAWTALLALFGSVGIMWGLNISGGQMLNVPFAFAGIFIIGFVGFAPKQLAHSAVLSGFSAFLSEDGLSRTNIGHELKKGLALHYRIFLVCAYAYSMAAFTLTTWSFVNSPSAFWIIFLGVLLLLMIQQVHGTSSAWIPKVLSAYAVACILISVWSTFGDAYSGRSFDARTGEPAYMVDPVTGATDSLNRTPKDCRPAGVSHTNFNYSANGTCFSAATGQRLVPITSDEALQRNPTSWLGLVLKRAAPSKLMDMRSSSVALEAIKAGSGATPTLEDVVLVNYIGKLTDGTQFDKGDRVPMSLDQVIPAFAEGITRMQKGGRYRLTIPADKAYGSEEKRNPQTGKVVIPANSDLVFEVDVIDFKSRKEILRQQQMMQQLQKVQSN